MTAQYEINDILKFSADGLRRWTGNTKTGIRSCSLWRWRVVGLEDNLLWLVRVDKTDMRDKTKKPEKWTPLFFELDQKGVPASAGDDNGEE